MKWMLPLVLLLAACGPNNATTTATSPTTPEQSAVASACLSEEQKAVVGQPFAQSRPVLPADVRIIPPNSLYTQEYKPQRVNVDVTEDYTITRVWCG